MALKDILLNAKYPDDMVLNLPDGSTVNVGEIRSLPAAERQAHARAIRQRFHASDGLTRLDVMRAAAIIAAANAAPFSQACWRPT